MVISAATTCVQVYEWYLLERRAASAGMSSRSVWWIWVTYSLWSPTLDQAAQLRRVISLSAKEKRWSNRFAIAVTARCSTSVNCVDSLSTTTPSSSSGSICAGACGRSKEQETISKDRTCKRSSSINITMNRRRNTVQHVTVISVTLQ